MRKYLQVKLSFLVGAPGACPGEGVEQRPDECTAIVFRTTTTASSPSPSFSFHGPARRAQFGQVFAFDAVSYFLQAFAGEILLIFPIVYGFTNSAPFNTWNIEFALYFFPFIITGVLPTVAALGWQKTPSAKVWHGEHEANDFCCRRTQSKPRQCIQVLFRNASIRVLRGARTGTGAS